jgi:hypothetical protein
MLMWRREEKRRELSSYASDKLGTGGYAIVGPSSKCIEEA